MVSRVSSQAPPTRRRPLTRIATTMFHIVIAIRPLPASGARLRKGHADFCFSESRHAPPAKTACASRIRCGIGARDLLRQLLAFRRKADRGSARAANATAAVDERIKHQVGRTALGPTAFAVHVGSPSDPT